MNPDLSRLQPYPFEKLARLYGQVTPPAGIAAISLAIGEPRHRTPQRISDALAGQLARLSSYPNTRGLTELRQGIASWLAARFQLPGPPDPQTQILPVNGTREALFAIAQTVIDRGRKALVLMPNPFYQIYEGAALLAGAEPLYLDCQESNGFMPDLDSVSAQQWDDCQLFYLCSPGNPTGAVASTDYLRRLLDLAERHDFLICADECYSEIYPAGRPPPGLLQVAAAAGNPEFRHCLVFHSLSKRSNCPGMRSGFVAGDARVIEAFYRYRTYHGCAMPLHHQLASIAAWNDEDHVADNRRRYQEKFDAVLAILQPVLKVNRPDAGFYLWPDIPDADDARFARDLFAEQHVMVLPGSYLSRGNGAHNPGRGRVRMALVADLQDCVSAARRIRQFIEANYPSDNT